MNDSASPTSPLVDPYDCGEASCTLRSGQRTVDAGMSFIRCPTCDVLRIPEEALIHDRVDPDPPGQRSLVMQVLFWMRMLWLRHEVRALRDRDTVIADIGCGDGQFLGYLRENGYHQAFGIEPDEARAGNARARGVPVFASREAAAQAGCARDGVAIMFVWQVLEHVTRPAPFLREYARWLAPGGTMLVSVPNQGSAQTALFGYLSAYPDYGRHVWYHRRSYVAWLRTCLGACAVDIVRDRNVEYEVFSWVDSIGSFAAREQNFVHRALKKGEGSTPRRLLATAMALALAPLGAALTPVSLLTRLGSTLTFRIQRADSGDGPQRGDAGR